jgi:hypothetical protein
MTYDKKLPNMVHEQHGGMSVDLGHDATYPMKILRTISFRMPSSDVIELNDVLFIPDLKKNLLSISCMIDL